MCCACGCVCTSVRVYILNVHLNVQLFEPILLSERVILCIQKSSNYSTLDDKHADSFRVLAGLFYCLFFNHVFFFSLLSRMHLIKGVFGASQDSLIIAFLLTVMKPASNGCP